LILGSSVLIDASRHLNHSLANGPNFRSRLIPPGIQTGGLVVEAIELLRDDDREIILMKVASEMQLQEIADKPGLSLSATKMRYYRALESFREENSYSGNQNRFPRTPGEASDR
jgi:hypothetical protein